MRVKRRRSSDLLVLFAFVVWRLPYCCFILLSSFYLFVCFCIIVLLGCLCLCIVFVSCCSVLFFLGKTLQTVDDISEKANMVTENLYFGQQKAWQDGDKEIVLWTQ